MSTNPTLLGINGQPVIGTNLIVQSINAGTITSGGNANFNHLTASTISCGSLSASTISSVSMSKYQDQFLGYTTTQRLALSATDGLVVFDTTLQQLFIYENSAWSQLVTQSTGSYTPSLQFSGGGTFGYSVQNGNYYVLGNVCFFSFNLQLSTFTGSGILAVSLPLAPSSYNTGGGALVEVTNMQGFGGILGFNIYLIMSTGVSYSNFGWITGGYANIAQTIGPGNLTSSSTFLCQGFYFV